jgi:hypothetical protein
MKTQQFTNWFKLTCGLSMLIVSTCFLINTISPARASVEKKRDDITKIVNAPSASMGVKIGTDYYFVDGGFLYVLDGPTDYTGFYPKSKSEWKKIRLTTLPESQLE